MAIPLPGPLRRCHAAACVLAFMVPVSCLSSAAALAHEFWLTCRTWSPAPGETVEIGACVGTGFRGERRPFRSARCTRFVARAARTCDLQELAREGDTTWARFSAADAGGATIAYESDFATIELAPAEFDEYLALEGLDGPLAARRASGAAVSGRERYRRCAKTWLDGSDARRASRPVGAPLEIVPLARPGLGPELRMRVLFRGRPLAGVLVKAWTWPWDPAGHGSDAGRDSVGVTWQGRTDRRGQATLAGVGPGEWLLSAVHMVPCPEPRLADWESYWASLTFACGAAGRSPSEVAP
jgi:uncharacterized GH25 family protein